MNLEDVEPASDELLEKLVVTFAEWRDEGDDLAIEVLACLKRLQLAERERDELREKLRKMEGKCN